MRFSRSLLPTVRRAADGFALLIVLWALVLIAFIVAHVTASGRTEVQIAANLRANSVERAAADGAIYEAIFHLLDPRPDQRWPIDGTAQAFMIGTNRVTVRLEDESSWINPSLASPALLEALLRLTGNDPGSAHNLATAITEWVGSAPVARPKAAVLGDYQAAGLDYGPPGAPLESLDELERVLGMIPATYARIRPHLTLFGPPQPTVASSDPIVVAALADPTVKTTGLSASGPPPDVFTTRITATAFGAGNTRVTQVVTVRIGAALPFGYQILAWGTDLE
jgi:general secretion pathway protein K